MLTEILEIKTIELAKPRRNGSVDTNDPSEIEEVVDHHRCHRYFPECDQRSADGSPKCTARMAFDANEPLRSRDPRYLLILWGIAVVVSFVKQHEKKYAHRIEDRIYPVAPTPTETSEDESSGQWPQIRREDDCTRPQIDLPRMLVEEKHVLDPHKAASLCGDGKETVQDACSEERVEGVSISTPDSSAQRHQLPEHEYW